MEPHQSASAPERRMTVRAKDLTPEARLWLGSLLHVDLFEDDAFTVTLHRTLRVPTPEDRAAARERLLEMIDQVAERTKDVPPEEIDAAIEEAMRFVRPRHL